MLSKKDLLEEGLGQGGMGTYKAILHATWQDRDSRRILLYIAVSFVCMIAELLYGMSVSSLGLINDGFHMMFNCVALSITLFAMVLARKGPTFAYTYGYDRHEVVAAFSNSMFLLFVSCFLALESLHRVVNPVIIDATRLIEVSVLGLVVNLVGAVAFKTNNTWLGRMAKHTAPHTADPLAHRSNLQAAYLLVFADTASSVCVVVNSVLVHWKGYMLSDPILALCVAGLTMYSTLPLFAHTGKILLQTTPAHLKAGLERCRREVTTIPGVLECKDEHFWTQAPGYVVGSVVVRVQYNANEQEILSLVTAKFARFVQHMTVQVDKDPPLDWLLPPEGSTHHDGEHNGHEPSHPPTTP